MLIKKAITMRFHVQATDLDADLESIPGTPCVRCEYTLDGTERQYPDLTSGSNLGTWEL